MTERFQTADRGLLPDQRPARAVELARRPVLAENVSPSVSADHGVARGTRRRGRPDKGALRRLKVAAVVVSVAAFAGTLGGIVALNPAIKKTASAASPASSANIVVPAEPAPPQLNSVPLILPPSASAPLFVPRARTRAS